MPDAELLAELKRLETAMDLLRSGFLKYTGEAGSLAHRVAWLWPRIIAALTPGGAVVGVHTASEAHDRPPGSERP